MSCERDDCPGATVLAQTITTDRGTVLIHECPICRREIRPEQKDG